MLTEPLRYDTASDVKLRLHGSIVRYKGTPVTAKARLNDNDDLYLRLVSLRDFVFNEYIHSSDTDLDISSPPLGYMNTDEITHYIQRIPTRKQVQGFTHHSASFLTDSPNPFHSNPLTMLHSVAMADTIDGKYPNGIEVLEKLMSSPSIVSIAFHRKFALMKDEISLIKLRHMGKSIGFFKPGSNRCIVSQQFSNPIFTKTLVSNGFEVVD
jgi:hypothetical protein